MKTNLDKLFKTNKSLEQEGIEFVLDDKTSFTLRRFTESNPKVKAALAVHYKPFAKQIQLGTLDPEKANEINVKVFVDAFKIQIKIVPAIVLDQVLVYHFQKFPARNGLVFLNILFDFVNQFVLLQHL